MNPFLSKRHSERGFSQILFAVIILLIILVVIWIYMNVLTIKSPKVETNTSSPTSFNLPAGGFTQPIPSSNTVNSQINNSQSSNTLFQTPVAPPTLGTHSFGVDLQLADATHQDRNIKMVDLAKQSGAKIIRIGISWRLLEQYGQGKIASWYLNQMDDIISEAQKQGLYIIMDWAQTPCWASSEKFKSCNNNDDSKSTYDPWYFPTNVPDNANALTYVVKRYSSYVKAWEIWNEPNMDQFWGGKADASQYTQILKASYNAIKSVDPNSIVLGGSLSGSDTAYLSAMYQSGAKGSFDALALHPYSANTSAPNDCSDPRWSFKCGTEATHNLMVSQGDNKNIWFTEAGWSTLSTSPGISEQTQAQYLTSSCSLTKNWSYVPVFVWYLLVDRTYDRTYDNQSTYISDKDTWYGLYHGDLTPKPAATAFSACAQ